jgi:hypothetical protein
VPRGNQVFGTIRKKSVILMTTDQPLEAFFCGKSMVAAQIVVDDVDDVDRKKVTERGTNQLLSPMTT